MTLDSEDVRAFTMESLLVIYPRSDPARRWFSDHVEHYDKARDVVCCEHRYGPDILLAAHNAGLSVALDGQMADAPRERVN